MDATTVQCPRKSVRVVGRAVSAKAPDPRTEGISTTSTDVFGGSPAVNNGDVKIVRLGVFPGAPITCYLTSSPCQPRKKMGHPCIKNRGQGSI